MTEQSFIAQRGFSSDPFAYTDSDKEEKLEDYFVDPPYFSSVIGDPRVPEPWIVFSPRGSGKSALRKMVELKAGKSLYKYLPISYMDFEWASGTRPTVEEHQLQISKLITLAILTELDNSPESIKAYLDAHQKNVLKHAARALLSGLTTDQYKQAMSSVKTKYDKAGDSWNKYGGVVAIVVSALISKLGVDSSDIDGSTVRTSTALSHEAKYLLQELITIAKTLSWQSVYVLVDRVDETSTTATDPSAAFDVVASLVTSLPALEQEGLGVKFFLWDQLEQSFREQGGRADRIMVKRLIWSTDELSQMLSRRLKAHSNGRVSSFNDLVTRDAGIDAHRLMALMAHGSPRDMIRIGKFIISEATRMGVREKRLDRNDVLRGVMVFSEEKISEIYSKYAQDFSRVASASFIAADLASDVFRIGAEGMRQKILLWSKVGAVVKVGDRPNRKNRPSYLYAFADPRIVTRVSDVTSLELQLDNSLFECRVCNSLIISSEPYIICSSCGEGVALSGARSLLDAISRGLGD